jgi:glycosyltransferase involved in cell wall biosynthesis
MLAFPSFAEGSAYVTYEALASGLPVVTTPNAAGSVVRHGRDGFIVPARSIEGLMSSILHSYGDRRLAVEMGAEARQNITTSYTWETYREDIIKLYLRLLEKGDARK